jgi:hypothetical protein
LIGGLELILKFGSITFLLVSFLMAYANFTIRDKTQSKAFLAVLAMIGLALAGAFIIYYEFLTDIYGVFFTFLVYIILTFCAWLYSRFKTKKKFIFF